MDEILMIPLKVNTIKHKDSIPSIMVRKSKKY
jgi:hypothetical protein